MDASNVGYVPIVEESTDESSVGSFDPLDNSESDISQELLTSNVGVMYRYQGQQQRLMDERKAQEHIAFRNKYFTPEIMRHVIYVPITDASGVTVTLKDFGVDLDRVIGFKFVKGFFNTSSALSEIKIIIPEIPYIACKKNAEHKHIVEVISVYSASHPQYYENKNLFRDIFFTPIKLSTLSISFDVNLASSPTASFMEYEITTLNVGD